MQLFLFHLVLLFVKKKKKKFYQNGKAEQIIYIKHFTFLFLPGNLWPDFTYFSIINYLYFSNTYWSTSYYTD